MTFWLIHGAWHDETCWELLAPLLQQAGHTVFTPRLPIENPDKQFADYAQGVLAEAGAAEPPVIVGHSMSSDVAAILASQIEVQHLVYLCPRMAIFERPASTGTDAEPHIFQDGAFDGVTEDAMGRSFWAAADAVRCMYRSLEPGLAARMASRLRPQANARRSAPPIVHPPQVESTFVYATEDEIFRPEWSAWASHSLVGVEPIALSGGHFPMLEQTAELATLLLNLA
jgi:pimeloyl-ACP methyl ester carboxylesterase